MAPIRRVMGKPVVSIITIFRNAEKYIEEAIASVCAQSYGAWELLLIDDGSSDRSTEIAKRYASRRRRIVYLEHAGHENRGMSASRNLGLAHASGEFVAFIDADDVWLPDKLAEQLVLMRAHPEAAMVYGRTLIWHSWSRQPVQQAGDYFLELGVAPDQLVQPPVLFQILLKNKAQSPTTCNALLRHAAIMKVGGCEESFRGIYEDQVLFAKIELEFPVYVAGQCWANYRQHPESSSAGAFTVEGYCSARLPFLNWLAAYVRERNFDRNSAVWNAVRKELWRCRHPAFLRFLDRYRRCERQWRACFLGAARTSPRIGR